MKVKAKGEIYSQVLYSTEPEEKDPIMEESLILYFDARIYSEIVGKRQEQIEDYLAGDGDNPPSKAKGSPILRGTFKISMGGFEFIGEKFSSAEIKIVKKVGAVIKLHIVLPGSEKFHTWIYKNFRKMIDITITEINEQMVIPDKKEKSGGEEKPPF